MVVLIKIIQLLFSLSILVLVHEFGHFLFESMAPYLRNIGGDHSGNTRLDPRLAFNEALGTWFSSLVLNNNEYQDTVGISPNGSIRVDHNLEFLSFSTHG
ncbi:MAG TPA: hypothetical protein PKI83_06545, partial [Bacteroidales bacterium]|nr:hypothetical protein [Bacteroidales bacterium]